MRGVWSCSQHDPHEAKHAKHRRALRNIKKQYPGSIVHHVSSTCFGRWSSSGTVKKRNAGVFVGTPGGLDSYMLVSCLVKITQHKGGQIERKGWDLLCRVSVIDPKDPFSCEESKACHHFHPCPIYQDPPNLGVSWRTTTPHESGRIRLPDRAPRKRRVLSKRWSQRSETLNGPDQSPIHPAGVPFTMVLSSFLHSRTGEIPEPPGARGGIHGYPESPLSGALIRHLNWPRGAQVNRNTADTRRTRAGHAQDMHASICGPGVAPPFDRRDDQRAIFDVGKGLRQYPCRRDRRTPADWVVPTVGVFQEKLNSRV